mmetsp:Transcript_8434/g.23275  ORF Transcript_8434/g.23275 Transcript_8434/m.23275 type:complete len:213 (+) Transcript_8434:2016-2654(+)
MREELAGAAEVLVRDHGLGFLDGVLPGDVALDAAGAEHAPDHVRSQARLGDRRPDLRAALPHEAEGLGALLGVEAGLNLVHSAILSGDPLECGKLVTQLLDLCFLQGACPLQEGQQESRFFGLLEILCHRKHHVRENLAGSKGGEDSPEMLDAILEGARRLRLRVGHGSEGADLLHEDTNLRRNLLARLQLLQCRNCLHGERGRHGPDQLAL